MVLTDLTQTQAQQAPLWAVFDDPQEWPSFSQAVGVAPQAPQEQRWQSQVTVQGMHCAACALVLEKSLLAVPGVLSVSVSAASQRASVLWSQALTRPSQWLAAPLALGYRLQPASENFGTDADAQQARWALWRWLVAGFCMMQIMMYASPAYFSSPGEISPDITQLLRWASWVLSLPLIFFSCTPFWRNALRDLKQRSISMDLPVALGIAITFAVSSAATFEPSGWWGHEVYFDSAAMLVFFLLTGRWLEQRLRARTSGALAHLMQRLPHSVERKNAQGDFERVAARRLVPGDVVRVLPGEAFPADGTIVQGDTLVDEALLTGESRPLNRSAGSQVLAGSHNVLAAVQVCVQHVGPSTRYAQIVALMESAVFNKPRLALLADRVAQPFLVFVLLAAAAAAIFWWPTDPGRALMAAVAVLVVTCPCALSLATPTAMLTTAGVLARQGVLVRRLQALESLLAVNTVVFDKTGTLTEARIDLRAVHTRAGVSQAQALQLAGALAQHSLHPVSCALVQAAAKLEVEQGVHVAGIEELPGRGLQGQLTAAFFACVPGRIKLGAAHFCDMPAASHDGLQVCLADEQGWLARFDLDETLRPDALAAVQALQARGVEVHILSGDREASVANMAKRLGIAQWQSACLPQGKLAYVQALQQRGQRVLMVGDGLNDGPVLASAGVSVAVGTAAALAQAQADFVLPGAQLMVLPRLLAQAHRTMHVVRQNLYWAAAYNLVCVPWALSGNLPAWLAGLGMALSSLLVMLNAARLNFTGEAGKAGALGA